MGKRPVWFWTFTVCAIAVWIVVGIELFHERLWAWMKTFYCFAKENIVAILTAFFLVKGKFVFKIFLKKILFLSATGLGKRYLIERVFSYHLKIHFLDHIKNDFRLLFSHIKKNFIRFPLTKKLIAAFAVLGSLGYVSKFMGMVLALKVMAAKLWSFLLALVLRAGSWLAYFFTDYLWGSWLSPLVELILFSWLFALLEKVPFLTRSIQRLYQLIRKLFLWFEESIGKIFHDPMHRILQWMLKQTRLLIYRFIGYKRQPAYKQLRELRRLRPNCQQQLRQKREARKKQKKERISIYKKLNERRS